MMQTINVHKVLFVGACLFSGVYSFSQPTRRFAKVPISPKSNVLSPLTPNKGVRSSHCVRRSPLFSSGVAPEKPVVNKLARFRQFIRSLIPGRRQHRQRLLGLVLATVVWLGIGVGAPPASAHDNALSETPAIERVQPASVTWKSTKPMASTAMTGRMATAVVGTAVVAPSAGLVLQHVRKNGEGVSPNSDENEDTGSGKSSASGATIVEKIKQRKEQEKRDMVDSMLQKAKDTANRQRANTEAFLKSVQSEKAAVSNALKAINKQMLASGPSLKRTEKPEALSSSASYVSESIQASSPQQTLVRSETGLPLMTDRFIKARQQPKSPSDEQKLAKRYGSISSVEDRAFQILLDLGMIEKSDDNQRLLDSMQVFDNIDEQAEPFQ